MISPRDVCSADHTHGADRRAALQGDVALAVRLALAAADRLEAVPRDARTACLYRVVLGHAPEHEVASARHFADSGALTAYRFRRVADALARRRVRFRCRSQPAEHPLRNAAVPRFIAGARNTNVIWLYPRYWSRTRPIRAGTLIHETLHLCCSLHDHGTALRRSGNAHCYEWLALGLSGRPADQSDLCACQLTPP
jgi:hypothetical protein